MTFLGQVLLPHPLSPSFTAHMALFMQSLAHPRPGWTLPAWSLASAHPETTQVSPLGGRHPTLHLATPLPISGAQAADGLGVSWGQDTPQGDAQDSRLNLSHWWGQCHSLMGEGAGVWESMWVPV